MSAPSMSGLGSHQGSHQLQPARVQQEAELGTSSGGLMGKLLLPNADLFSIFYYLIMHK